MNKSIIIIAIVICCLLSMLIFPSIFVPTRAAEIEGDEINLTDDPMPQGKPAIYGDYVVWNENVITNGNSNWEIFLYDLSVDTDLDTIPNYLDSDTVSPDPARIRITNNISDQLEPEIYGDKLVWEDKRHGNFDIFMYDLSEDTDSDGTPNFLDDDDDDDTIPDIDDPDPDLAETRITDNPAHQEKPAIYRNKIVWVDKRFGNQDIFIYDILLKSEAIIVGHNETGDPKYRPIQDYPKLYGNYVVWQDDRFSNSDIFLYDLSVDSDSDGIPNYLDEDRPLEDYAERQITTTTTSEFKPVIYGDRIAYIRMDNIYLYDLSLETEYRVTQSGPLQNIGSLPCSFYANKLVWMYYDEAFDIYLYDLQEDTDFDDIPNYMDSEVLSPDPALKRITNESQIQVMLPFIYADKIVWQDSRNTSKPTDRDIYIFTLTENKAPKIDYPVPNKDPQIKEGDSLSFLIEVEDPEGDELDHIWFLDGKQIPGEYNKSYKFSSDHSMAGIHEIKVIVSDGEYPIEHIWILYITESGLDPIDMIWVTPPTNPAINEGEKITFHVYAFYYNPSDINVTWTGTHPVDGFVMFDNLHTTTNSGFNLIVGEITSSATYTTRFDFLGPSTIRYQNIIVNITDGQNNISYTWRLSVHYYDDADFDGYPDSLEETWASDPLDFQSTPTDLDNDLILDSEDNDIDGDGFLGKYDADDTDFNKQSDGKSDYSVEILIILISTVLLVASFISLSRASKK